MPRNRKPNRKASTRRAIRRSPAAAVRELQRDYVCSHCISGTGKTWQEPNGISHVQIIHDDSCPVLNGTLPDTPDLIRASGGNAIVIVLGGGGDE